MKYCPLVIGIVTFISFEVHTMPVLSHLSLNSTYKVLYNFQLQLLFYGNPRLLHVFISFEFLGMLSQCLLQHSPVYIDGLQFRCTGRVHVLRYESQIQLTDLRALVVFQQRKQLLLQKLLEDISPFTAPVVTSGALRLPHEQIAFKISGT